MKKKLTEKDKVDWQKFINNKKKLVNKDNELSKDYTFNKEKTIDLHGYTLDKANQKIASFIENCFSSGVSKINIITGKGLRSKNLNDPFQSSDLSILKYSVPEYIKNNPELMNKILKIDFDDVENLSKGSFQVFLKNKK